MKTLLCIGAGAINRAFIPWVFPPDKWEYYYEDTNTTLISRLSYQGYFTTWRTHKGEYEPLMVPIQSGVPKSPDLIITAVGPRNFMTLSDRFMGTTTPIICCENDSRLPRRMSDITGNPNIHFAIPDVISSNTAPSRLLRHDTLSVVTEEGTMYLPSVLFKNLNKYTRAQFADVTEMKQQWMAKLYLHNTPHCITAYMGYQKNCRFIHEAIAFHTIHSSILNVMTEMQQMVTVIYHLSPDFASWYCEKEIARFTNPLLTDPISRVAREPMRKLALSDRLIGAAMLCLQCGIVPTAILQGIKAAVMYDARSDPDYHIMKLYHELSLATFVQGVLHVRTEEKLYPMLMEVLEHGRS